MIQSTWMNSNSNSYHLDSVLFCTRHFLYKLLSSKFSVKKITSASSSQCGSSRKNGERSASDVDTIRRPLLLLMSCLSDILSCAMVSSVERHRKITMRYQRASYAGSVFISIDNCSTIISKTPVYALKHTKASLIVDACIIKGKIQTFQQNEPLRKFLTRLGAHESDTLENVPKFSEKKSSSSGICTN